MNIDTFFGVIHCESNVETMTRMPAESIDLIVTSPPYDGLRDYKGYTFDFEQTAQGIFKVLKPGGVCVWIVGDQVVNGGETGTSFRHALRFIEIGLRLHDTMIYNRFSPYPETNRYHQCFEYMFVLSKGKPKTANIIADHPSVNFKRGIKTRMATQRMKDGSLIECEHNITKEFTNRPNIWFYACGRGNSTTDDVAFKHPAIFPEKLAKDHIYSWSNPGEIVYDPFMGSGTTAKCAHEMGRLWIGSEISAEYIEIAKKRIDPYLRQKKLL